MTRTPRVVDTGEYMDFARRVIKAAGERAALADPDDVAALVRLAAEIDVQVLKAVRGMRAAGYTWDQVGWATGTTRQGAHQKWARQCTDVGTIRSDTPSHPRVDARIRA